MKNSELNKITLAENNLNRINFWISHSDAKIGVTLVFLAGLIGIIVTKSSNLKLIANNYSFTYLHLVLLTVILLFIFFLIRTIYYAFISLYPDISTRESSLFFFGSIATKGAEKYKKEFQKISVKELLNELNDQAYINSKIAFSKFTNVKNSIKNLIYTSVFWLMTLIFIEILSPITN